MIVTGIVVPSTMRDYRNYLIGFLGLTTVAAGYWAWSESTELRKLKSAAPAANSVAEIRRQGWQATRESTPDPADITETKPETTPESRREEPKELVRMERAQLGAMAKMLENPEFVRLLSIQQRAALDGRYAALFKKLGLTPEQLDKFKDLLVEKQSSMIDVFTAARAEGLNPRTDREALRELALNAQQEVDATIRSALGDSVYQTYQQYEQTIPYRNVVESLAERLSYSPSPLTGAQTEQLVQIIADTSKSTGGANAGANVARRGAPLGGIAGNQTTISDDTVARAQGILTPDQQTAFVQLQQEQSAAQKLRDLQRTSRESGARP